MSATVLSPDYIAGWRRWSDMHSPANFEVSMVTEFLDSIKEVKPLSATTILEIGCGDGRVIREFAPIAKSVIGVDTNAGMIEFLKSEIDTARLAIINSNLDAANVNVAVEEMSGTSLKFEDESFDLVLYPWSLHQIPNKLSALSEAKRVLKNGGALVVFGLLPGGEYEVTVKELGLDPGPEVDPIKEYEQPLKEVFNEILLSCPIGRNASDKEFGFLFPDHETAIATWKWALQNWHEHRIRESDVESVSSRLSKNTKNDRIFMNIHGKAYLCLK